MKCEGILLFVGRKGGILLDTSEIKRLVELPICKLYVLHMQTNDRASITQMLRQHFSDWLNGRRKEQDETLQVQECPEDEVSAVR